MNIKRITGNLGFAADANQGVRALEVSLLLLLIAYLHSVLAPLFPNFVPVVHDVNRSGAGEGGLARKKPSTSSSTCEARGVSIATTPALPVGMASALRRAKPALHGGENVAQPAQSKNALPLASSIPEGAASLESILCTEELQRRPSRPPDHAKENAALVALASALAESRHTILDVLADTILRVTDADSSGLSLLTSDGATPNDEGQRFYWPAIKGMWKEHVGGGTPRDFGPCGDVLDRDCTLLFRHFERRYPYLLPVSPAAEECLLVPFYVRGKAVGTIWAMMHSDRRRFDSEDQRLMSVLGQFASLAYQTLGTIDDLNSQVAAREKAEARLRALTDGLEAQVRTGEEFHRVVVETASDAVVSIDHRGDILQANHATTTIFGYEPPELIGQPLTILMPEYPGTCIRQASSATRKPVIGT